MYCRRSLYFDCRKVKTTSFQHSLPVNAVQNWLFNSESVCFGKVANEAKKTLCCLVRLQRCATELEFVKQEKTKSSV
ncbi:hypothetical protein RchiOBHm_Chr1g0346111 [Rosa chinensis]|uniref:Uncharacterized protein n=1 Tax=Rosa chinensis TaxID=74649 RepID=A0A2P6SF04_ROSCH|nr:hypothetical protein RchiOBHm_Chr1g0346111 [Rosa chinensis]